jgi:hypothetical protein
MDQRNSAHLLRIEGDPLIEATKDIDALAALDRRSFDYIERI